ncbi:MAG: type II toxin-antitoxin system VapB family antitoxin [Ramlibacter sp.]
MNTRTNIVLDDKLVAKAMKLAGVKTKKAAVEAALKAYVRKPDYSGLLALAGSGVIADDYDPKEAFSHPRSGNPLIAAQPLAPYAVQEVATPAKSTTKATGRKPR